MVTGLMDERIDGWMVREVEAHMGGCIRQPEDGWVE